MSGPTRAEWAQVKLAVFDVDGVLTDGTVLYGADGELAKQFFIRDGMGLRLLEAAGVRVAVVTTEDSPVVAGRVKRLMLSAYLPGRKRKGEALRDLMREFVASREETLYMGDDVNDAEAFEAVGISSAPADASDFARPRVRYLAQKPGGQGAVREVCDLMLEARDVDLAALWASIHTEK